MTKFPEFALPHTDCNDRSVAELQPAVLMILQQQEFSSPLRLLFTLYQPRISMNEKIREASPILKVVVDHDSDTGVQGYVHEPCETPPLWLPVDGSVNHIATVDETNRNNGHPSVPGGGEEPSPCHRQVFGVSLTHQVVQVGHGNSSTLSGGIVRGLDDGGFSVPC